MFFDDDEGGCCFMFVEYGFDVVVVVCIGVCIYVVDDGGLICMIMGDVYCYYIGEEYLVKIGFLNFYEGGMEYVFIVDSELCFLVLDYWM